MLNSKAMAEALQAGRKLLNAGVGHYEFMNRDAADPRNAPAIEAADLSKSNGGGRA